MKNKITRDILYIVLFVALFIVIQAVIQYAAVFIYAATQDNLQWKDVLLGMTQGKYGAVLAASTVLSSLITIAVFAAAKWAPVSRTYLKTKPWGVIFWVVCLAFGSILPMEWIYEKLSLSMPEQTEQLFEGIMKQPWGYAAIGLLVPIAEEMVFRGGVLRKLLDISGQRLHWVAIVVSALIFALLHGNLAQGTHAFLMGLLLGWMYYRTKSIIPSVAVHWVNNTVAYIMYNIMPQMNDGKLIDLFHGSDKMMYLGLAFSLCIFIPAIIQLAVRMKPAKQ